MKVFFQWTGEKQNGEDALGLPAEEIGAQFNGVTHFLVKDTAMDSILWIFEEEIGRPLTDEEASWVWQLANIEEKKLVWREF